MTSQYISRDELEAARKRIGLSPERATTAGFRGATPEAPPTVEQRGSSLPGFVSTPLRIIEEIDRPISERLGFAIPSMPGPLDEIGNFAIREATRPTNLLIGFGGAAVAGRLAASGSRAARAAATLVSPVVSSPNPLVRLAGEVGVVAGAKGGSELTDNLLPDDAGPIPTTISNIVGGLAGAMTVSGIARAIVRPLAQLPITTVAGVQTMAPPPLAAQYFGAQPVRFGTTDMEELQSAIRKNLPGGVAPLNEIATPIIREKQRILRAAESVANETSERASVTIRSAFNVADDGVSLPKLARNGTIPTVADVAAQYPVYESLISPQQRAAMEQLRQDLAPYREMFIEAGGEVGTRLDVMDGGFYIPRGNALEEGLEAPKSYSRGGRGGKASSEKEAVFNSQAEGIAEGWEYTPFDQTINGYIRDVGRRTGDLIATNYFKNMVDVDGRPLAQTAADRISPAFRKRVSTLKAKTRASRDTLMKQQARTKVTETAAERAARVASGGVARSEGALARVPDFDPADLIEARAVRNQMIEEARYVNRDLGRSVAELRYGKRELSAAERAILKNIEASENTMQSIQNLDNNMQQIQDRLQSMTFEAGPAPRTAKGRPRGVKIEEEARTPKGEADRLRLQKQGADELDRAAAQQEKLMARLERQKERLTDEAEKISGRVDELYAKGEIYRELDTKSRGDIIAARQQERLLYREEARFKAAERELRMLELERNRLLKAADKATNVAQANRLRAEATSIKYDDLRDEWRSISSDWKSQVAKSRQIPQGRARLNMPGLEQYDFPQEVADYVNDWTRRQGKTLGDRKLALDVFESFNNIYRAMKATLDFSGLGIQALLGGYSQQKAFGRAAKLMMASVFNEKALGGFFDDFNLDAVKGGRASTSVLAANGLHYSGGTVEFFQGGTKLMDAFLSAPGIKQSNRAFSSVGDGMRTLWADAEVAREIGRGRTLDDLVKSGDLRKITEAVNRMTGYTDKRFGGSFGDFILFAPRYLQSRLETVALGAKGFIPGAAIDERMARNSLLKMIGLGVATTAAVNEFFGGPDDWADPVRNDGSLNPNFMKMRVGGRDWSLFGPWDSLLRVVMATAEGKPEDAIQSMGSGTLSLATQVLTGESFMGDRTRDTPAQVLKTIGNAFVPLSSSDILENAKTVAGGDPVGGVVAQIAQTFGVKQAIMTPSEKRDEAAQEEYNKAWFELTGQEKAAIEDKYPSVMEKVNENLEKRAERGEPSARYQMESKAVNEQRLTEEAALFEGLRIGDLTEQEFADALDKLQADAALKKQTISEFLELDFDQTIPENRALTDYYSTFRNAETYPGVVDWELQAALEAQLIRDIQAGMYGDAARAQEMIDERRSPEHHPSVNWYYENKKVISESGYYDSVDEAFETVAEQAKRLTDGEVESYADLVRYMNRAEQAGDVRALSIGTTIKSRVDKQATQLKKRLRLQNPDLDAALVQNKGLVPIRSQRR